MSISEKPAYFDKREDETFNISQTNNLDDMTAILSQINDAEESSMAPNIYKDGANSSPREETKGEEVKEEKRKVAPEKVVINALFQFLTNLMMYDIEQPARNLKLVSTIKYVPSIDYF